MIKLSTGDDSTLGSYLRIAKIFGPKAVKFFEEKIKESPNGKDEEVITDELQMMFLLSSFLSKEEQEKS